jgi:hypothetical protein
VRYTTGHNMKRKPSLTLSFIGLLLILIVSIFLSVGTSTVQASDHGSPKMTICHATGYDKNPYIRIVVWDNADQDHFNAKGEPKHGHKDDLLFDGVRDCPEPEEDQAEEASETPCPEPSEKPDQGGAAAPEETPTPAPTSNPTTSSRDNSNSSTTTPQGSIGEVLGAATLAPTGQFGLNLALITFLAGFSLISLSALNFVYEQKKTIH